MDNYLAVSFDLSQVLFIANAKTLDTIPGPLRDRMEILGVVRYTDEEKIGIPRQYLIPKVLAAHGLATDELLLRGGSYPPDREGVHPRGRREERRSGDRSGGPEDGPSVGRGSSWGRSCLSGWCWPEGRTPQATGAVAEG